MAHPARHQERVNWNSRNVEDRGSDKSKALKITPRRKRGGEAWYNTRSGHKTRIGQEKNATYLFEFKKTKRFHERSQKKGVGSSRRRQSFDKEAQRPERTEENRFLRREVGEWQRGE